MVAAKFIKQFLWLGCLVLLIFSSTIVKTYANPLSTSISNDFAQAGSERQINPIFRPIVPELEAKTRVPLLLPSLVPQPGFPLYATVNSATVDAYELTIGDREQCSGGNYCRYGTVSGEKTTPSIPSVEQQYAFMHDPSYQPTERSPEKMGRVVLTNDVRGYFIPYVCGANCDDAKVIWEQNGYRYLVGLKRGDKKAVVQMANSAIASSR